MTDLTGDRLREIRHERRETQAEFAKHFEVDQSTIARWENEGPPTDGPFRRLLELGLEKLGIIAEAPSTATATTDAGS